jgi:hypothetical protein
MKIKSAGFSIGAIVVIIIIQAWYLKSLPGSLVRVYYARDMSDFNKAPADDMTVVFDGYRFDYRIAFRLNDGEQGEIGDLLKNRDQADMQRLIDAATWVRKKMSFGESGGSQSKQSTDSVQPATRSVVMSGLCDRYANYFAAACQAGGIPARVIELNGHVVPEAFLRDAGRWVMVDPTLGYYMVREEIPLSVAEIISVYNTGDTPKAVVFAAARGDDSLYSAADESTLRAIYRNGFTVVSNQQLGRQQILSSLATSFSLPVAKVQYVDGHSIKIGRKEHLLRSILALNLVVAALLAVITALNAIQRRKTP